VASFDAAIPPGQAGKVQATIAHTDNLRGPVTKYVAVTTDDPARPNINLGIRANFVGSVQVLPVPSLFITIGQPGEQPSKLLVRKDETETGTFAFSELMTSVPWLSATGQRIDKDSPADGLVPPSRAGDVLIEVKATGEIPGGQNTANVTFKTGLPREPVVTIPVTVRVLPEINLQPAYVVLPAPAPPSTESQGFARLGVRRDLDPAGLRVEVQPEAFKATMEALGDRQYRIHVTWTATAGENTPRDGRLTARLGNASANIQVRVNPPVAATPPVPPAGLPTAPVSVPPTVNPQPGKGTP
jgi:hypothetical protein